MNTEQERAAFEAWAEGKAELHKMTSGEYSARPTRLARDAWQAALASPEVQALRDALEKCRFALEPYDDIKPRDWVTDRQNLRNAHQATRAALAAMEKQK